MEALCIILCCCTSRHVQCSYAAVARIFTWHVEHKPSIHAETCKQLEELKVTFVHNAKKCLISSWNACNFYPVLLTYNQIFLTYNMVKALLKSGFIGFTVMCMPTYFWPGTGCQDVTWHPAFAVILLATRSSKDLALNVDPNLYFPSRLARRRSHAYARRCWHVHRLHAYCRSYA